MMSAVWIVSLRNEHSEVKTPDGKVIPCVTNRLAIDIGRKQARDNHGCLEVYDSEDRLWAAEHYC